MNAITDVPDVRVGHHTAHLGEPGDGPVARTGATAILPHGGNLFRDRVYGAVSPFNGYGQVTGSIVVDEWGLIGSPIVVTDTVHVGVAYSAIVDYMSAGDPEVGRADVAMPIVAECDDGFLNDNRARSLTEMDVRQAIESADIGPVREGCVGAGTGTQLFEYKGGVGTASRLVRGIDSYTIGVLLNTNYGRREQLTILGAPVGQLLKAPASMPRPGEGSCIAIVATDAPLHPLQLRRVARRVDVGLARTGSVAHDGSGEISVAFSTAQTIPRVQDDAQRTVRVIPEGQFWTDGTLIDRLFKAVAEATEEASLNALLAAETTVGRDGNVLEAAPRSELLRAVGGYRAASGSLGPPAH
jgi:D-aminopeptidase